MRRKNEGDKICEEETLSRYARRMITYAKKMTTHEREKKLYKQSVSDSIWSKKPASSEKGRGKRSHKNDRSRE